MVNDPSNPDPGFVPMSPEQLAKLQDDITSLLEELDSEREKSASKDELIRKLIGRNHELVDAIGRHREDTTKVGPADLKLWKAIGEREGEPT